MLYDKYPSFAAMTNANIGPSFIRSGIYFGGNVNYQGEYGTYWSGTAGTTGGALYLRIHSSGVNVGGYDKYLGLTVRSKE